MVHSWYVIYIPTGGSHAKFQLPKTKIDPPPAPPKVYVVNAVLAIWAIVSFSTKIAATATFFELPGWISGPDTPTQVYMI